LKNEISRLQSKNKTADRIAILRATIGVNEVSKRLKVNLHIRELMIETSQFLWTTYPDLLANRKPYLSISKRSKLL
jgi:hypothetical protein